MEGGRAGKETDNGGIKIGLHSSWTQHSFSYTNDILYRVYRVRVLVALHKVEGRSRKERKRESMKEREKEGESESVRARECACVCACERDGNRLLEVAEFYT